MALLHDGTRVFSQEWRQPVFLLPQGSLYHHFTVGQLTGGKRLEDVNLGISPHAPPAGHSWCCDLWRRDDRKRRPFFSLPFLLVHTKDSQHQSSSFLSRWSRRWMSSTLFQCTKNSQRLATERETKLGFKHGDNGNSSTGRKWIVSGKPEGTLHTATLGSTGRRKLTINHKEEADEIRLQAADVQPCWVWPQQKNR